MICCSLHVDFCWFLLIQYTIQDHWETLRDDLWQMKKNIVTHLEELELALQTSELYLNDFLDKNIISPAFYAWVFNCVAKPIELSFYFIHVTIPFESEGILKLGYFKHLAITMAGTRYSVQPLLLYQHCLSIQAEVSKFRPAFKTFNVFQKHYFDDADRHILAHIIQQYISIQV